MSDLIPLYGFVDDGVFLTKSGDLGVVLALEGVDYECLDPQQREAVTTRFEVALRLWDERTRLYQYVLKRNRVAATGRRASASGRRRAAAAPPRVPPGAAGGALHACRCTSSWSSEPDRPATAWASQARRALRAAARGRRASGSRPRARSSAWTTTSTDGACSCATRSTPSCSSSRTRSRPALLPKARGLHVLPAPPELHAGEGRRRPPAARRLSRLRHVRLGARVSSHASAPR